MKASDEEYGSIFGVLLVATWLNTLLYTLEIHQARNYFKTYWSHDPPLVRRMVMICVGLDTVSVAAQFACVYLSTVTHWGDQHYVHYRDWPIPMYLMATSSTAFVVQAFLIRRYYYLSRKCWVPCVTLILSLGAIGGAYCVAVLMIVYKNYDDRRNSIAPVTTWLTLSAATDCSIAAALVVQLQRMKSGFKSSESLIRRITFTSIQTGAATSILALLSLAAFAWVMVVGDMFNNVPIAFGFCLGSTYTLTMLHNLNKRKHLSGQFKHNTEPLFQGEPGSLGFNMTGNLPVKEPQPLELSKNHTDSVRNSEHASNFHPTRTEASSVPV